MKIHQLDAQKSSAEQNLEKMNEVLFKKSQQIEQLEMKVALLELEKIKLKGENGRIQDSIHNS